MADPGDSDQSRELGGMQSHQKLPTKSVFTANCSSSSPHPFKDEHVYIILCLNRRTEYINRMLLWDLVELLCNEDVCQQMRVWKSSGKSARDSDDVPPQLVYTYSYIVGLYAARRKCYRIKGSCASTHLSEVNGAKNKLTLYLLWFFFM